MILDTAQLLSIPFISVLDQKEHSFLLYLPPGYDQSDSQCWPLILFLHGNGERGNGRDELNYILCHGPLYEAWIQKRDLPFVMISPQLPMFNMDCNGDIHLQTRTPEMIPTRLSKGVMSRSPGLRPQDPMDCKPAITDMKNVPPLLPFGWEQVEADVMGILRQVLNTYRIDRYRIYLTGISYGGFGTWYLAHRYPQQFAAIAPVAGWGHPELMAPIAKNNIPLWVFAGGRDEIIHTHHFYAGLNCLEALGHSNVRFTVHADMGHDVWRRVYAGEDLFAWFLTHRIP